MYFFAASYHAALIVKQIIQKGSYDQIEKHILELVDPGNMLFNVSSEPAGTTVSAADEPKKFAELKDMGVITEAEFEEKKRKLLE